MPENSARFFRNEQCEYFPCHKDVAREDFNCLFCFCPLNPAANCGGDYRLAEDGEKDCSQCSFPHRAENYQPMIDKINRMLAKRELPENGEKLLRRS